MKKSSRNIIILVAAIIVIGLIVVGIYGWKVWFAYNQPPRITIINNSPEKISEVLIEGRGCSASIGKLDPDENSTVILYPFSASGLEVSFRSKDGKIHKKSDLAYIEPKGGYFVIVHVTSKQNIEVFRTGIMLHQDTL